VPRSGKGVLTKVPLASPEEASIFSLAAITRSDPSDDMVIVYLVDLDDHKERP
jgi:hypothetical protein